MPCWSIHLGVCKEVNKVLNLDEDLMYFGCVLPDILNKDYSHFYDHHKIDFNQFFNVYGDVINHPLMMGYYIHLLTDFYYNKFVYDNSFIVKDNKVQGIKLVNGRKIFPKNPSFCREFKQYDFKNYGSFLIENNLLDIPRDVDKIYNSIKKLNIDLDKNTLIDKLNYFNSKDFYEYNNFHGYKLFNKDTYDLLYKDCVNFIILSIQKSNCNKVTRSL